MKIDTNIYIPSPQSTLPNLNVEFKDSIFDTNLRRISSASTTKDEAFGDGRNIIFINPEYSTVCPFNKDNTKLLLFHQNYHGLYNINSDNSINFIRHAPFGMKEPRWTDDKDIFIFISGNTIKYYDIKDDKVRDYYTFSEYKSITASGEGDLSTDKHYIGLIGDNKDVFIFDCFNLKKSSVLTFGDKIDGLYVTPDDNLLISFKSEYNNTAASQHGIELYDKNMIFLRRITEASGHMDTLRVWGRESLVWASYGEVKDNTNSVIAIDLATGDRNKILTLDKSLALHISAADADVFYIETYGEFVNWPLYGNEILRIETNGPLTNVPQRVCHHRSKKMYDKDYTWQPKTSCDRSGRFFVFGSNWGLAPHKDYSDTYFVDTGRQAIILPDPIKSTPKGREVTRWTYNNETFIIYKV